jgi:quercetin dioxygenase-like cupin family protein
MASAGDSIENPVTRDRIIFRQTARETNGALLQFEEIMAASGIGPPEHVHPRQHERIEVLAGTLGGRVGGRAYQLQAGQHLDIAPGTAHTWWNAGTDDLRLLTDFRPALQTELFFETLYGLARDGRLNARGMPRFLQIAVLVPPCDMFLAKPPVPLQRALFALLAPVARMRGYRLWYPEYSRGVPGHAA